MQLVKHSLVQHAATALLLPCTPSRNFLRLALAHSVYFFNASLKALRSYASLQAVLYYICVPYAQPNTLKCNPLRWLALGLLLQCSGIMHSHFSVLQSNLSDKPQACRQEYMALICLSFA